MEGSGLGISRIGLDQHQLHVLLSGNQQVQPPSTLTDELSRRLNLDDEAERDQSDQDDAYVVVHFFSQPGHDAGLSDLRKPSQLAGIVSKWRQKERLKTTAVTIVMCLNIGVDPPDVIRISPCARLECWVDPMSMQAPKALETIGKNLQAQYERWQPRAKYKMHLDPTVEDVKKLAISSRKNARTERVLFHYNGHGVPRPTANGEIWVFNKHYTQYIPMSLYDLQTWVGTPAIYVFDCSAGGLIINSFKGCSAQRQQEMEGHVRGSMGPGGFPGPPRDPMQDTIILAACGANELLPQNPELPADVFTACLTTPIKVALRWFCSRSLLRHEWLHKECIDRIPGKQTDRKTPLGELNWIFTAITDTIAWNMLPRPLFQKLFRQDLLVASLFRNYLLAERIMRAANCTPQSYPRLPPTHQHPMWQAWDYAAEMCLLQLPALMNGDPVEFQPSTFFSEQLTAFELWLEHGSRDTKPPEQLPIVLQVLLSQVHRLRALVLLGRFLDLGEWAVDLALSVGIFPYVLKLLQTTATDLRQTLVFIWTKILALDKSCQSDLVKDNAHMYFVRHLECPPDPNVPPASRAQAAFILSVICDDFPRGQRLCGQGGLLRVCMMQLPAAQAVAARTGDVLLLKWLLLLVGKLCENSAENTAAALSDNTPEDLARFLTHPQFDVRAAAVFALGALITAYELPAAPPSLLGGSNSSLAGAQHTHGDSSPSSVHSVSGTHGGTQAHGVGPGPMVGAHVVPQQIEHAQHGSLAYASVGQAPHMQGMSGASGVAAGTSRGDLVAHVGSQVHGGRQALSLANPERAVIERTIACHMLNVVYDASPLVRAEVGVALARLASGHSVLWQDAVHLAQKKAAAVMRSNTNQRSGDLAAHSAPSATVPPVTLLALRRTSIEATTTSQALQDPLTNGTGMLPVPETHVIETGLPRTQSRSQPVSPIASPGVRPAANSEGYEPRLQVGIEEQPPIAGVVFASPDAARVGGGMYSLLLDAVCTLATDPSPKVAQMGQEALAVSSVELVPLRAPGAPLTVMMSNSLGKSSSTGGQLLTASSTASAMSTAPSGHLVGSSGSNSSVGAFAKLNGKLFRGTSFASSSPSVKSPFGNTLSSTPPVAVTLSPSLLCARTPFVLQRIKDSSGHETGHGDGALVRGPQTLSSAEAGPMAPLSGRSSDSGASHHDEYQGVRMPPSPVYRSSCEYFSGPLLARGASPAATSWPASPTIPQCTWSAPNDTVKAAQRQKQQVKNSTLLATIQRKKSRALATLAAAGPSCALRKDVQSCALDCGSIAAVQFEPFGNCFVAVDSTGVARVYNYSSGPGAGLVNRFHVALGGGPYDRMREASSPVAVVHMSLLNEAADDPLLLLGAADGAVRVWRGYSTQASLRLATAWQAVPVAHGPGQGTMPSTYCLGRGPGGSLQGTLFAAGGAQPQVVQLWDMRQELRSCEIIVQLPTAGPTARSTTAGVEYLCSAQSAPLLFAGCKDGHVLMYDIRQSQQAVQSLRPFQGPLAGMVAEPGGTPHNLTLASPQGALKLLDFRMPGLGDSSGRDAPQLGVWKTVEAHSKGNITALAAHPNAPLLATGTSMQAVKLWSAQGEQLGVIRTTASLLQRIGAVNCLAFHPLKPLLSGGGGDGVVALYNINQSGPQPGQGSSVGGQTDGRTDLSGSSSAKGGTPQASPNGSTYNVPATLLANM